MAFETWDDEIIQDQVASWNNNEIQCLVPASITDDSVDVYVHTDTMGDVTGCWSTHGFEEEIPLTKVTLSAFSMGRYDVGMLLPNAFGLYDMNVNVWVWCNDYGQIYSGNDVTDPIAVLKCCIEIIH